MVLLFVLFMVSVFFLYRDPKGHDGIRRFSGAVSQPKETVSVMTYNIGFGAGLDNLNGVTYKKDKILSNLDGIVASIKTNNPDILCVQEIDVRSRRSYLVDEVQYLAEKCGYPYVAVAFTWNRYYIPFPFTLDVRKHFGKVLACQATFSKYPIKSQIALPLPQVLSKPWWYRFFYLQQVAQVVTIEIGDKQLDVVNLHFEAFDKPTRQRQADYLVSELEDVFSTLPLIVAGDFNALHTNKDSLIFEDDPKIDYGSDRTLSFFKNTTFLKSSAPDLSGTFPSNKPDRLLDYIFYNPKFFELTQSLRCDDAKTSSDHLPIFTEFKLNI